MQQLVVCVALTDDKISIGIVQPVFINMVDTSLVRKWFAKGFLCDEDVCVLKLNSLFSRVVPNLDHYIAVATHIVPSEIFSERVLPPWFVPLVR